MTYKIEAATSEDIQWIAKFEAEMYSAADAVPQHILSEWYQQNPDGFWILKHKDVPLGHIDILPVKPEIFQNFILGIIGERDIRGVDLYSPQQKGLIKSLYVESVAISPSNGHTRAQAVNLVLAKFFDLVNHIAESSQVTEIYAIAATAAGQRFLNRLGFRLVKPGADRKDQHDLFGVELCHLAERFGKRSP